MGRLEPVWRWDRPLVLGPRLQPCPRVGRKLALACGPGCGGHLGLAVQRVQTICLDTGLPAVISCPPRSARGPRRLQTPLRDYTALCSIASAMASTTISVSSHFS